jgi:hypothetical protein
MHLSGSGKVVNGVKLTPLKLDVAFSKEGMVGGDRLTKDLSLSSRKRSEAVVTEDERVESNRTPVKSHSLDDYLEGKLRFHS